MKTIDYVSMQIRRDAKHGEYIPRLTSAEALLCQTIDQLQARLEKLETAFRLFEPE